MSFLTFIEFIEFLFEFVSMYYLLFTVWKKKRIRREKDQAHELNRTKKEQKTEIIFRISKLEDDYKQLIEQIRRLDNSENDQTFVQNRIDIQIDER